MAIKTFVSDYKDQILSLYPKHSASEIARMFNFSSAAVVNNLRKWGCDLSVYRKGDSNNRLKDKSKLVESLYNDKYNIEEIAKIVDHAPSAVRDFLINLGYNTAQKLLFVDETFFEKINTREKAYILGIMYSDGCVHYKCFKINLQEEDKEILEKIRLQLKYEGELEFLKNPNVRCKDQYQLRITRKKMVDDLKKLGCVEAKSNIIQFPTEDIVPKEFIWDFIRGIFDGDGSIRARNNSIHLSFAGCKIFNNGLKMLFSNNNIECKEYLKAHAQYSSEVVLTKTSESIKVLKLMYQNDTISMVRKKEKWENYHASSI